MEQSSGQYVQLWEDTSVVSDHWYLCFYSYFKCISYANELGLYRLSYRSVAHLFRPGLRLFTLVWETEVLAWPDKYNGARSAKLTNSSTYHSVIGGIKKTHLSHSLQKHPSTELETLLLSQPFDLSSSTNCSSITFVLLNPWFGGSDGTNASYRGQWQIVIVKKNLLDCWLGSLEFLEKCRVSVPPLAGTLLSAPSLWDLGSCVWL